MKTLTYAYPLVIWYIAIENGLFEIVDEYPAHSMLDLSSSQTVTVYQRHPAAKCLVVPTSQCGWWHDDFWLDHVTPVTFFNVAQFLPGQSPCYPHFEANHGKSPAKYPVIKHRNCNCPIYPWFAHENAIVHSKISIYPHRNHRNHGKSW